ncbi:neuronal acetylcholine receptor subunit alpha-2-like isoform X2 [Amphiura filiformis]|uniref:neuronal acetylcholine receptor subunit alpha-2-like isoform X2 n=1 Tax=Amphiura filiformis TaxID=82378 RepID=UPI003B217DE0
MAKWRKGLIQLICSLLSLLVFTIPSEAANGPRGVADTPNTTFTPQHNTRLFSDLFVTYHKEVTPRHDMATSVQVGLSLVSFDFIDEANDLASVHGWLKMAWTDERLKWDPSSYDNITVMRVNTDHIWIPDIELYNGVSVTKLFDNKALLYSNGYVYNLPSYRIEFKCPMNLRYFPYDEQRCSLKYGSWAHDMSLINLTSMNSAIDMEDLRPSADFRVINNKAVLNLKQYPCCPNEIWSDITFSMSLKRTSSAYSAKLVLPSVLTGFLILLTFLLPPASHEKITLCGITFLALLLLLVYLQSIVPASGDTILGEYLAFALFIDFFAMILAVVSYNLHVRKSQPVTKMLEGDDHDLNIQMPAKPKRAWLRYLDMASFVIFSIVFIVGLAIMLGRRPG